MVFLIFIMPYLLFLTLPYKFPLEGNVCGLIRVLPLLCQLSVSVTLSFISKSEWHKLVHIKLALEY